MDRRASDVLGIPTICLMENAGSGAARVALRLAGRGRVAIVCGPGQNGGDGLVVARHLSVAGVTASVVQVLPPGGSRPPGDAGINRSICEAMGIGVTDVVSSRDARRAAARFGGCMLVVDALYGTGLSRPLRGPSASLVRAVNACGAPVLALDVPSGLDCDSGRPLGPCVRAACTATFGAAKRGFRSPGAREWTGRVVVVPLGVPV